MKKIVLILTLLAIVIGLYEQAQNQPNVFRMVAAIVLLMFGLMKLSEKIPSKESENEKTNQDDTQ